MGTGAESADTRLHFVTVVAQEERVQEGKARAMLKAAEDFGLNLFQVVFLCRLNQWVKRRRGKWTLKEGRFWSLDYSQEILGWLFRIRNYWVGRSAGWQTIGLRRLDPKKGGWTCHSLTKELHPLHCESASDVALAAREVMGESFEV